MYQLLLADDEVIERMVIERKLKKYFGDSLEIIQAENGRDALALFHEKKIEIVLMDISMPGMDGMEAAEQMHEENPDCQIIFLTAFDEFSFAKRAIAIRALEYLVKPVSEKELFSSVEEAVRQIEALRIRTPKVYGTASEDVMEIDTERLQDLKVEAGELRMNQVVHEIQVFVKEHFMEEISMQDAARALNYSDAYFCKLFKQCFDENFTSYLMGVRMNEAKKLLKNSKLSIREISNKVGYADPNYFAKVFKRRMGVIPRDYRLLQENPDRLYTDDL